ncbi:hypothetical protein ACFL18_02175 [Patescibacteria group bacterium]
MKKLQKEIDEYNNADNEKKKILAPIGHKLPIVFKHKETLEDIRDKYIRVAEWYRWKNKKKLKQLSLDWLRILDWYDEFHSEGIEAVDPDSSFGRDFGKRGVEAHEIEKRIKRLYKQGVKNDKKKT